MKIELRCPSHCSIAYSRLQKIIKVDWGHASCRYLQPHRKCVY
ncbi:hypothetical protein [Microvirga tunisiensis]